MVDESKITRRTVLAATGVTLGAGILEIGGSAARQNPVQDGSGASVDWYNTYSGSDVTGVDALFNVDGGYVVVGNKRITKIGTEGETIRSNSLPTWYLGHVRTSDGNYLHAGYERQGDPRETNKWYGLVSKTDGRGNELWRWSYDHEEGNGSIVREVVAGPDGGGYAFGRFKSDEETLPLGVRLDADGNVRWKETWETGSKLEYGPFDSIAATNGGAFISEPQSAARITPDGKLDWLTGYEWSLKEVVQQSDGGYVVTAVDSRKEGDIPALLYLNEQGERTRTEQFEVPNENDVRALRFARTAAGFVVGSTVKERTQDGEIIRAWVLGLTPSGDQRWYVEPGDHGDDERTTAIVGSEQRVVVGGGITGDAEQFVTRITEGSGNDPPATASPTPSSSPTASDTATECVCPQATDTKTRTPIATGTTTKTTTPTGTLNETPTATETVAPAAESPTTTDVGVPGMSILGTLGGLASMAGYHLYRSKTEAQD